MTLSREVWIGLGVVAATLGGYFFWKKRATPKGMVALFATGTSGTYTVGGDVWNLMYTPSQWSGLPSPVNKGWSVLLHPISKNTIDELTAAIDGLYA